MQKRKYTNMKGIEPEIIEMRREGKTRQEIAEHFGLDKKQIKDWVTQYNRQPALLGRAKYSLLQERGTQAYILRERTTQSGEGSAFLVGTSVRGTRFMPHFSLDS